MKLRKNKTVTAHDRHDQYFSRQFEATELTGEKIEILHQGIKVLEHIFTNEKTHFSINLNDRSVAKRILTADEREQAIDEFYINHSELFP